MDRLKMRMFSAITLAVPMLSMFSMLNMVSMLHAAGTITVTPTGESTALGGQRQYSAMVGGLANSAVTWTLIPGGNGNFGSINASGLYTAPATMPPNATNYTITATSVMDATIKGSAAGQLQLAAPVLSGISPASAASFTNFTLTCTGVGFQPNAMIWVNGVQHPTKFISSTQASSAIAFYKTGVMAVSVINPGSAFSNPIGLNITGASSGGSGGGGGGSNGVLTVAPKTPFIVQGTTQQFSATLSGAAQAVTWSATAGSINAAGLYTAPAQLPNPPAATVTATGAGQTATATVTILTNVPPTITSTGASVIPTGVFSVAVTGTGFGAASQATLGGSPLSTQYVSPTQLAVSGFASQSGTPNLVVSNGSVASLPFPMQIGVPNPIVSASAARRFLQQGAFGPTPTDAAHVQQVGFQGWLTEQFQMPQISNYQLLLAQNQSGMPAHFLTNAVMQPDQLRQKVAFALSQILVTSLNKSIWTSVEIPYQEMLMADAFTNYRKILGDVTLSATMGQYLDMANNGKGNAAGTVLPNENYAREILQLFSIGTWQLKNDGAQLLDASGNPIPTYNQKTISEFARVFTGWTYLPQPGKQLFWNSYINPTAPLQPYPSQHDNGPKTLLNGAVIQGGLTIQADMNAALDNIFNHPNVGPFLCKQLIQHLVTSNPSPAYVTRVATVFNNPANRGDMQAVIGAILLDPDARQNDSGMMQVATDGHLQEPALFVAGVIRAFGGIMTDQNYFQWDLYQMSQDLYNSPSVFNYYSPGYVIPQSAGVLGPEFEIYTPYTSIYRDNLVAGLLGSYSNPVITNGAGTTFDLTPFMALANSPATLVDALDFTLTCGTMPAAMKQLMVQAVTAEAGGNLRRVETGAYLILASGYYNVWH